MKFILFNSPIYKERSDVKENYLPPLGLAYIATNLSSSGVDVNIIDCVKEHYGIKEIFEVLDIEKPDFIGINIFTQNYETVKEIAETCPINTTLVIGGQVVKCIYNEILLWNVHNPMIIIAGEGELILPAVVLKNCSEKPIAINKNSVVYKVDINSIYYPNNLDLVHINRSILIDDIITNHYGQREAAIITSRGCVYNCAFCGGAHNLNNDVSIRFRSINNVNSEILDIMRLHPDVTSIRILDDLFLRDNQSICNAIELFTKHSNLTWRGMAHVLTFNKSLHTLPMLKRSGCRELFIGIESGSQKIRKKINKPGTPEEVIKVVTAALKSGIDVKGYFMFGFPDETIDDADATYNLAKELCLIASNTECKFRLSVFQFRPYHGTQLYKEIIDSGRTIIPISSNENLNIIEGRSQFNFQSGNYSNIDDDCLNDYIIKTQNLSESYHNG